MTDERVEQLVFNGVSGVTGTYGEPPVTGEELAARILSVPGGAAEKLGVLERQLQRDRAQKIAAIVDLLAESSFEDAERDAAWQEAWLGRLAELLATKLLGGDYTTPVQVKRLADRLRRDPKGKVVAIVTSLAEDKAKDLAKLLLVDPDEAPDNTSELKERMKLDALIQLGEVRNSLLTRSLAEELEGDQAAQRNWLETFLAGLHLVPIQALNSLKETRGKVRPLEPLRKELDALANAIAQPSPWLEGVRQELSAQPKAVTWIRLLEPVGRQLEAWIDVQDDPLRWTDLFDALRRWLSALDEPVRQLGVIEGVDPNDLSQAGWGIIFPYEDPKRSSKFAGIEKQLEPLLTLRKSQAGTYFQVYKEGRGYRPGDTASQFLARYGARPSDPADPAKVPYYLLLVGNPEEIPFAFQQQLDVQYAVGRIDFDDLEAYARYARSVVAAEVDGITQAPRVAFFAPANPGDTMTKNSVEKLVEPLYERLKRLYGAQWQIDTALRDEANKARLLSLLGGKDTPALLFAACHGIEFPKNDAKKRQARCQGALVCQEWRGPGAEPGEVPAGSYFSADDLGGEANLLGLIAFFFACYGAGTPRFDEYSKQAFKERGETITDHPFVAALPKAMLSLSKGGALAVVGHVERAWGTSFIGPRNSEQIAVFQSAVERLLKGQPVGSAMEYMNGRYAAVSTELTAAIENIESFGLPPKPYELAELWTANNDARGYVVIGDPAVRLPVAQAAVAGGGGDPAPTSATGRRDLDGG